MERSLSPLPGAGDNRVLGSGHRTVRLPYSLSCSATPAQYADVQSGREHEGPPNSGRMAENVPRARSTVHSFLVPSPSGSLEGNADGQVAIDHLPHCPNPFLIFFFFLFFRTRVGKNLHQNRLVRDLT